MSVGGRWAWLLLVVACVSCGDPEPFHEWTRFESEEGWSISYLSPPWQQVDDGAAVTFLVQGNASVFGSADASFQPKYLLAIEVNGADPAALARAERGSVRAEEIIFELRPVTTHSGVEGFEFAYRTGIERARRVFLAHSRGSLRLDFVGTAAMDSAEMDAMVSSVQVDP